MNTQDLYDGWSLTAVAGPVPTDLDGRRVRARVPGTSHTALLEAGLIPDPYLDRNEEDLAWMQRVDWAYERDLDLAPRRRRRARRPRLRRHRHRRHAHVRRPARSAAPPTSTAPTASTSATWSARRRSACASCCSPPLVHAEAEAVRLGPRPLAYHAAVQHGPQDGLLVRLGLGTGPADRGPVAARDGRALDAWPASPASARSSRSTPTGTGRVEVHATIERSGPAGRRRTAHRARPRRRRRRRRDGAGRRRRGRRRPRGPARPAVVARRPRRTAAVGAHGRARRARTRRSRSTRWTRRIGFRTVELDTSADDDGTAFTFRINGRPIFVKGANWIPDDHLLTRITRERLAHRLDQAVDANLNLSASGAAGSTSPRTSTTLCDERGLLVWQDFLLACAAYPEEQPLWDEIEAEAREHVARLTPHPSLVLWNGGNENLWGFMDWGWQEDLQGRTWGFRYATELLKDVVAELDPTRPYSDGSPYSPGAALDRGAPERPRPRHPPPVGGLEPRRLPRLRRRRPALLLGVRVPGPARRGPP